MHEYLQAFNVLNKTRTYNMVPMGIQYVEILAYLQIYGASDVDEFVHFIKLIDNEYLKMWSEKHENKPPVK